MTKIWSLLLGAGIRRVIACELSWVWVEELPEIRWKIVASNLNGMADSPAFGHCCRMSQVRIFPSPVFCPCCSALQLVSHRWKYFEKLLCFLAMYNLSNKTNSIISKRHMKSWVTDLNVRLKIFSFLSFPADSVKLKTWELSVEQIIWNKPDTLRAWDCNFRFYIVGKHHNVRGNTILSN